jgi:hypothetical protein
MVDTLTPLILDFVQWVAAEPRSYADAMETWRTSCPRLTIWEDSIDRELVILRQLGGTLQVEVTPQGRTFLSKSGRVTVTAGS